MDRNLENVMANETKPLPLQVLFGVLGIAAIGLCAREPAVACVLGLSVGLAEIVGRVNNFLVSMTHDLRNS